jgi:putative tryptophan/tyrosine transport system substrate-binding protein
MRRRDFITLVGGAVLGPLVAHAQQPKIPVIGFLSSVPSDVQTLGPFRQGLADFGFIEDQNVTVLYRYADGQYERLPGLAVDLVGRRVDVIVALPSSPAAIAAKQATSTIPIVFSIGVDPIGLGLVTSYSRPGTNVTGINIAPESLTGKRFELLNDLVPKSVPIAELLNPNNKIFSTSEMRVGNEAARKLNREIVFLNASTEAEITNAFDEIAKKQVGGLIVSFEGVFVNSREQIVSLASRYKVPTVYPTRQFTELGGLLSYGPNLLVARRQVGAYVGKILNGARPADLPVMTPTTYDLAINLKTAKALGIAISQSLLVSANEVIE